jgi:hypothetical protein
MPKVIFNFLISPQTKRRFEAVCASNGQTMSAVLNGLIESYVIEQAENLEHRTAQLHRVDAAIMATDQNRTHRAEPILPDHDDGPISPIYHDGEEFDGYNF